MLLQKGLFFAPDDSGGSGGASTTTETEATQQQTQTTTLPPTIDSGEWEKKYKGLQTVVNRLNGDITRLTEQLATATADNEGLKLKITVLEGQVLKLNADLETEKKNVVSAQTDGSAKELEAARLRMLVKEFPQLAPFEVAGALPAATTEEEMRTRFKGFSDALSSVVGSGVNEKLKGASFPADTSKPVEANEDGLYEQLVKLAGRPDKVDEYRKLQAQYDKLVAARLAKS